MLLWLLQLLGSTSSSGLPVAISGTKYLESSFSKKFDSVGDVGSGDHRNLMQG